jgi:hypothetical protein
MKPILCIKWITFTLLLLCLQSPALAKVKGIYLTQSTTEHRDRVEQFVKEAKETGINTFIIDANYKNTRYAQNIAYIKSQGINYVARVVVFPHGGTASDIKSPAYWQKRWEQAAYAISLGASEIQLDYIRYKASQPSSEQNAKDVLEVIKYFKQQLKDANIPLQIDIFGVAAHQPSLAIGQNVPLFANSIDVICPMVYPSHYEPHPAPSKKPYETVFNSITALKNQLKDFPNVKVYAYIEANNYRYSMPLGEKEKYIEAQIKAANDAGADGWYVWSPQNKYQVLFALLKDRTPQEVAML